MTGSLRLDDSMKDVYTFGRVFRFVQLARTLKAEIIFNMSGDLTTAPPTVPPHIQEFLTKAMAFDDSEFTNWWNELKDIVWHATDILGPLPVREVDTFQRLGPRISSEKRFQFSQSLKLFRAFLT